MLGVQDQAGVEHLAMAGDGSLLGQHVIEVGGVIEIVARREGSSPCAEAMEGRHDRRHLGDQTDHRIPVALRVGDVAGRVKHAHGGHAGLQGVHRMARFGQALDQVVELVLDPAVVPQLVVEVGQLALRGQLALEQQPGRLFVTARAGQGLDGDAAIFEAGTFAVDETDRRFGDRHVGQARMILQLAHDGSRQGEYVVAGRALDARGLPSIIM